MTDTPLLEITGLGKSFGGLRAVAHEDLGRGLETAHDRHLKIQENYVGFKLGDSLERFLSVLCFPDDFDFRKLFQFLAKHPAPNRLIVHDQCGEAIRVHTSLALP